MALRCPPNERFGATTGATTSVVDGGSTSARCSTVSRRRRRILIGVGSRPARVVALQSEDPVHVSGASPCGDGSDQEQGDHLDHGAHPRSMPLGCESVSGYAGKAVRPRSRVRLARLTGVKSWEWDPTLYDGSAPYYRAGRLPYSPQLTQTLRDALGLDGSGRLLDVGTGPGIIGLELAPLFEEVVGVDADADMVAEAEQESRRRGCTNARWLCLRSEELPAGLGTFRLVSFANSFHWMKRDEVAVVVRGMLDPAKGSLVLINAWTGNGVEPDRPLPHPLQPEGAITQLVERYLGSTRRAGQGTLPEGTPSGEEDVLARAGFSRPRTLAVPDDRVIARTMDEVVASVFAVSRSAPHLFGDRLAEFDRELRALLLEASPDGLFSAQAAENKVRDLRPELNSARNDVRSPRLRDAPQGSGRLRRGCARALRIVRVGRI